MTDGVQQREEHDVSVIAAQQIRDILCTFRRRTASGATGWRAGDLLALPMEAMEELSAVHALDGEEPACRLNAGALS